MSIREALKRSQERNERKQQDLGTSGEFVPRETLSDEEDLSHDEPASSSAATETASGLPASVASLYAEVQQKLPAPIPLEACLTIQDEEIVSLRRLLGAEKVQLSESIPRRVAISLREPTFVRRRATGAAPTGGTDAPSSAQEDVQVFGFPSALHLVLIVTLPARYPNPKAPVTQLCVRSGALQIAQLLDVSLLQRLEASLQRKSVRRVARALREGAALIEGEPLTLAELVEAAERWLESHPAVAACARRARAAQLAREAEGPAGVDYAESVRHLLATDFAVLSADEILAQREQLIRHTYDHICASAASSQLQASEESHVTLASVRVLLRAFQGDSETLLVRWRSTAGHPEARDALLAEAGLQRHQVFVPGRDLDLRAQVLVRGGFECPGCYEDFEQVEEAVTLPCGHFFCQQCMRTVSPDSDHGGHPRHGRYRRKGCSGGFGGSRGHHLSRSQVSVLVRRAHTGLARRRDSLRPLCGLCDQCLRGQEPHRALVSCWAWL